MRRRMFVALLALLAGAPLAAQQQAQPQQTGEPKEQFVCILRLVERLHVEQNWTPADLEVAGRHMAYLKQLTDSGTAILVGRTPELDANTVGIIVFEAKSMEDAQQLMRADPMAQAGMSKWEVLPFRVFMQRKQ